MVGVLFRQEAARLGPALCYEDMLEAQRPRLPGFRWARMEDDDACGLCYTSGTTGRPKVGACAACFNAVNLPSALHTTCLHRVLAHDRGFLARHREKWPVIVDVAVTWRSAPF